MSLLIKALESAEKGKQAELTKGGAETVSFSDLGLEPLPSANTSDTLEKPSMHFAEEMSANKLDASNAATVKASKATQHLESNKDYQRQAAANVFVANQAVKQSTSMLALLMLGVAGALIIWLGLQGYEYYSRTNTQPQIVTQPAPQVAAAVLDTAEPSPSMEAPQTVQAEPAVTAVPYNTNEIALQGASDEAATLSAPSVFAANKTATKKPEPNKPEPNKFGQGAAEVEAALNMRTAESKSGHSQAGSSLRLLSRTPAAGVDPTLQAAYEAYTRGEDAAAQAKYRQVLQADTRNVDALLGMAAIALRQSRQADANGWYQKVLEIEPRNSMALSAIANLQISSESAGSAATDYAATESQLKTMLAQQPEAANLHAALGNLYAAQNQWPQAQAAYFNASRFAPNNADYAFNLAVSLDQLGKSSLALAQYQRALSLLNSAGHGNLDKAQLEARIKALQP